MVALAWHWLMVMLLGLWVCEPRLASANGGHTHWDRVSLLLIGAVVLFAGVIVLFYVTARVEPGPDDTPDDGEAS